MRNLRNFIENKQGLIQIYVIAIIGIVFFAIFAYALSMVATEVAPLTHDMAVQWNVNSTRYEQIYNFFYQFQGGFILIFALVAIAVGVYVA